MIIITLFYLIIISVRTSNKVKNYKNDMLQIHLFALLSFKGGGPFKKPTYQFKHLVFQEFLCALYICLTKNVRPYEGTRELSQCTSTIMGINRILKEGQNEIFTELFANLTKTASMSYSLTVYMRKSSFDSFIGAVEEQNQQFADELDSNLKKLVLGKELFIDLTATCREYTKQVFETQHRFSTDTIEYCKTLFVVVNDLCTQTDLQHALYLLDALQVKDITNLMISFEELVTYTEWNVSKLINLALPRGLECQTEIVLQDHFTSANNKRNIVSKYRRKKIKIYIPHDSRLKAIPQQIKLSSVSFTVRGPFLSDQELSPSQRDILLDLATFVMERYPTVVLFVHDGPSHYWLDHQKAQATVTNNQPNTSKSKLLFGEFGGNDIFSNCVTILCED